MMTKPKNPIAITGGTVIDPGNGREQDLDLLISGGIVEAVDKPGAFSKVDGVVVIDAAKKWVVPGLIDLHVHLREPGFEWKETIKTGSEAAALGGFSTICCMPNTNPVNDCTEV